MLLPMMKGMSEAAAWEACRRGVLVPDDGERRGLFGNGIYLTSSLEYASSQARKAHPGEKVAVLMCVVVPGCVFPITETPKLPDGRDNPRSFLGKGCQPGFHSHYALGKLTRFAGQSTAL